jgi:hypothetical protein
MLTCIFLSTDALFNIYHYISFLAQVCREILLVLNYAIFNALINCNFEFFLKPCLVFTGPQISINISSLTNTEESTLSQKPISKLDETHCFD